MLEKAAVDADVARLARLERAHHDDQHRLRCTLDAAAHRAEKAEDRAADLQTVIGRVTDTRGDRFTMTIASQTHTKRVDAGGHLQRILQQHLDQTPPETTSATADIGTLGGLTVTAQAITTVEDEVRAAIPDAHIEVTHLANDLTRSDPASLITRLERQLHRLPETVAELNQEATSARAEAERAGTRIGAAWDRAEELDELQRRQKEIEEQLAATTDPAEQPPASPITPAAPTKPPVSGAATPQMQAAERVAVRLDALQNRTSTSSRGVEL